MYVLAFDIGGAHVTAALCFLNALVPESRFSFQTDDAATQEQFLSELEHLGRRAMAARQLDSDSLAGIAVAVPGPFDEEKGISYVSHKIRSLYGVSVRNALAERFCIEPLQVQFLNDAEAFLLGELSQPRSYFPRRTVGITLGTGLGSSFAVEGVIVRSGAGVPDSGAIWNLPWGAGIVEEMVSTEALESAYERDTGHRISVREMALLCPGDAVAVRGFKNFGTNLGLVLDEVCGEFVPELLIVGGGISKSSNLFLPEVYGAIGWPLKIEVSVLLEDAALVGAALSWSPLDSAVDTRTRLMDAEQR